eukprot:EG_transcript_3798
MRRYLPSYSGAAIQAAEAFPSEGLLRSALVGTPFAFSVTAFVGALPVELRAVPFLRVAGRPPVAPSLTAIRACASSDVFDGATQAFDLQGSQAASCYPLAHALYLTVQRQCPPSGPSALTVPFIDWVFSGAAVDSALGEQNVVPLRDVSAAVNASNEAALFQLSCRVRPTPPPAQDLTGLLAAVIVPVAVALLLLLAGCGGCVWRVTASNRALRKQFSDDNVAERCAEAIARFDLASVAWLQDVAKPSKIQNAFIAIVGLLTEVKPYIPDQLLSQLTSGDSAPIPEDEGEALLEEAGKAGELVLEDASDAESVSTDGTAHSRSTLTLRPPPRRSVVSSSDGGKSSTDGGPPSVRCAPAVQRQVTALRDWSRKRCTYLCVHFGVT